MTAWETVNNEGCSEKVALAKGKAKAKGILLQMQNKTSNFLLKIATWIVYKVFPYFIQSTVVLPSQIEMLKKASETGLPLILLPLHRSHLDYVILSFILVTNNIKNPLIAAGENLQIQLFGYVINI